MGSEGLLWVGNKGVLGKDADIVIDDISAAKHIPAIDVPLDKIVNTSGAGDSFCAGLICGLMPGLGSGPSLDAIRWGMQCASKSLIVNSTISPDLKMLDN